MRLVHIYRVLAKHGIVDFALAHSRFRWLSKLYRATPWSVQSKAIEPSCRLALEELGPVFVKLGQMLSTRRDLLTPAFADELALLQDRVKPFPYHQVKSILTAAFEQPLDEVYASIDETPLASASIAQVHAVTLAHNQQQAVIKVLRPGIRSTINDDVKMMYLLARTALKLSGKLQRFKLVEVVAEYDKVIHSELDLLREAANASQLRRNFEAKQAMLKVPEMYWDYCNDDVITMERIYGLPSGDVQGLRDAGINMKKLAALGVEVFFTQVFEHNFFHADMHPGNVFINPDRPENPQYIAVDFGIVGSLQERDKRYLAENLHAFFHRDYKRVAKAHIESGWVPEDTPLEAFEDSIRAVCEPIFQLPIKDISYGKLLLRLFQVARTYDMEVQPQLVLLQKTLLNIEGMGREIYPELNLWDTAKPFLNRWMDQQMGLRSVIEKTRKQLPFIMENFPELPKQVYDLVQSQPQQLQLMKQQTQAVSLLQKSVQRLQSAVVILTLILTMALIWQIF